MRVDVKGTEEKITIVLDQLNEPLHFVVDESCNGVELIITGDRKDTKYTVGGKSFYYRSEDFFTTYYREKHLKR